MVQNKTIIKNDTNALLKSKEREIKINKAKLLKSNNQILKLKNKLAELSKNNIKIVKENNTLKKKVAARKQRIKKQKTKKELEELKKKELQNKIKKAAIKKRQNIITQKRKKDQEENEKIFISLLCEYIKTIYPHIFVQTRGNRKHSIEVIMTEIFDFLKRGTSYNLHKGNLKKSTLNDYVIFFAKENIYQKFYWYLHQKYATKNLADNLKNQSTDTSFIINQYGLEENVARNPFMKNKNCIKISLMVDIKGVPIDIKFVKGNKNDSPLLREHLNEMTFNPNTKKYINNNRYKQTFMADAGYDGIKNRTLLKEKGYKVIIPINRRNTNKISLQTSNIIKKDKISLQTSNMTEKDKKTYKKRTIIENKFSNFKQFRRVAKLYDRCINNYKSFAHLALSKLLFNLLKNENIYEDILCKI